MHKITIPIDSSPATVFVESRRLSKIRGHSSWRTRAMINAMGIARSSKNIIYTVGVAVVTMALLLVPAQLSYAQNNSRTSNMRSGTITTGGTFQQIMPSNSGRSGCLIQNTSTHTMYVYFGAPASATTVGSFQVDPNGGSIVCNMLGASLRDPIQVTTSTTGDTFVWNEF